MWPGTVGIGCGAYNLLELRRGNLLSLGTSDASTINDVVMQLLSPGHCKCEDLCLPYLQYILEFSLLSFFRVIFDANTSTDFNMTARSDPT